MAAAEGYQPNRIVVAAGQPVRLNFRRDTSSGCYAQLLIPDFGIAVDLPEGETVPVEFMATTPGEYEFMCGMKMNFGTIEVRPCAGALNGHRDGGTRWRNRAEPWLRHGSARFRIGSVTKQFTAATILQLQDRGLLDVQAPVATYPTTLTTSLPCTTC